MLEQYYADLAKYAGDDWMDEEYEDGEVWRLQHPLHTSHHLNPHPLMPPTDAVSTHLQIEHSSTSSSVVSPAQTSTSSPTGIKRRPSNQHSKFTRQVGNTSNNSSTDSSLALALLVPVPVKM